MSVSDFAIPILGFILAVLSARELKEKISAKKIIELFVGLLIMGFSIWASIENSESLSNISASNQTLQSKLDDLLEKRRTDSNNNEIFQKYLKDTFGIERQGDKPIKVYFNDTKNFYSNSESNSGLADSLNYNVKLMGDILYISPKEGTWSHGYFAFDTSNSKRFNDMLEEGMGTPNVADKISVNNKVLNTHLIKIYDRAVFNDEPIKLNISAYKNGYLIFGEQGNNRKRYLYKQGKVIWIPN